MSDDKASGVLSLKCDSSVIPLVDPASIPLPLSPMDNKNDFFDHKGDPGSTPVDDALLPLGVADKILWRFSQSQTAIPLSTAREFDFPNELIAEVQSTAAYAFSIAAQSASVDLNMSSDASKPLPDPNITLYCPHNDCHDVVDDMVKKIALVQGADVVVLDSLELTKGKFGVFGEEVLSTIESIYRGVSSKEHATAAPKIQMLFNAIVNVKSTFSGTPKRVIYLRGFQDIAKSATSLLSYLLNAVRQRRTSHISGTPPGLIQQSAIQPTILVLGFSHHPGNKGYDHYKPILTQGGRVLRELLNPIQHIVIRSSNTELFPFVETQPHLVGRMFLPFLMHPSTMTAQYERHLSEENRTRTVEDMKTASSCLAVFPKDAHSDSFKAIQRCLSIQRHKNVWNAWIAIYLDQKGGRVDVDPLSSILKSNSISDESSSVEEQGVQPLRALATRTKLMLAHVVTKIMNLALGLSVDETGNHGTPFYVTSAHLSRACDLFVANCDLHAGWAKQGKQNKMSNETKPEDVKDPGPVDVVEKVKTAGDLDKYENRLLGCIVDTQHLQTTFDDVRISRKVVGALKTIVCLPLLHPGAFSTGILQRESMGGVLLYGPPGTGKTMVIRALALECKARMLQIKPSDIADKYVGETDKLVRAVFTLARRLAPCVIFIDELDALFGSRGTSHGNPWRRDMLIEFMQAMDGLQSAKQNKDAGVVVVGATNRPFDLDDAVLRRLPTRMLVGLPSQTEREEILRVHLKGEKLHNEVDIALLASRSVNYSGSDLKYLCVSAAMASVNELLSSSRQSSMGPDGQSTSATSIQDYTNANSGIESTIPGPVPIGLDWAARTLRLSHFDHAFTEVRASSTMGSHCQLYRWHETFGEKDNIL
ncbi:Protein MSP1 [Hypsizygus marmoreus]|uniref:Protein MSP1 n=1 Tax=Hypsizygus marmoreus TaxID=39966 RepID=A0A369JYM8_HYPMA|nr:Protein MSP1 [Hypsizygus marmoreus]